MRCLAHLLLAAVALAASLAQAHEIPSDVQLKLFVKPEGRILRVLIRVPLEAMRDIEFAQRDGSYLDLAAVEPQLRDAAQLWLANDLKFFEAEKDLGKPELTSLRIALPNDRAFDTYNGALEAIRNERLTVTTELYWEQALLDVEFEYVIDSSASRFYLMPSLGRLGLHTVTQIRYLGIDGAERGFGYVGDPGKLSLDPSMAEVAALFVVAGFQHVLDGMDHLLFLLVLVLPVRRLRPLLVIVTAFTLAHSITLIASMLALVPGALWFPPLIEMLIAASIVYMALENLLRPLLGRRWLIAFGFGLVHGFGFAFALRESLQFAGDHLSLSLFAFNIGIELGQILVLAVAVPLLHLLLRKLPERASIVVASAFVVHTAWHWLGERWDLLGAYRFVMPEWNSALLAGGMRWLMLLLVAALAVWLLQGVFDRWSQWSRPPDER